MKYLTDTFHLTAMIIRIAFLGFLFAQNDESA